MNAITAVVITYNEERNIHRCIASLRTVAEEIIIVDSYSTDNTVEICKNAGVTVIQHKWAGFGEQKNVGINAAANDYILSLDADEELDDKLVQSILNAKERGLKGAYMVHRLNFYYGKFIYHGNEYPDKKIRLFNRKEAMWNTELVHETLQLKPNIAVTMLQGKLLHYTYYKVEEHLIKSNKYTNLSAADYFRRGKKAPLWKIVFSPFVTFIQSYIFKRGFLDGTHGFIIAILNAHASFSRYVKLWELYRTQKKAV